MTIFGWDMSHYDSPTLGTALSEGISFVTHKAGGDAPDPELPAFWSATRDLDVLLGAYWVLYPGNPAGRADAFLARLDVACPGWRARPFLLQVDCEKWNNDPATMPGKSDIKAFCDRLVAQMPKLRPVVYAPKWAYGDALTGLGYPIWASSYVTGSGGFKALYPGDSSVRWAAYSGQTPAILQYSSSATIGGRSTSDANAYRGTPAQLKALVAPGWEKDMDLTEVVYTPTGDQSTSTKVPAAPRTVAQILSALDLRTSTLLNAGYIDSRTDAVQAGVSSALTRIDALNAALAAAVDRLPTAQETAEAVIGRLAGHSAEDIAAALRAALGDQATAVGRLLTDASGPAVAA